MFCRKFLLLAGICCWLPVAAESESDASNEQSDSQAENAQKKGDTKKKAKSNRCILFDAFELALMTNKDILALEYEIRAFAESYAQKRAAMLPTVGAKTGFSASNTDNWVPGAGAPANNQRETMNEAGLFVNYRIFHGLSDLAAIKEFDCQARAQWSKYEAIKQKVLREVAAYYFEIYAKMQELLHIRALLKSRQESLKVAQEMYNTGGAKYLDVAQASASCAEVEAKLAKANSDYQSLRAKFTELSGFVLPFTLSAPKQLFDTSMSLKQGTDLAMRYNPNIIASADNLAAAREAEKKPLGKLLPAVDIHAGQNIHSKNPKQVQGRLNDRELVFRIEATWTIFDAGAGRSEKRQMAALVSKAAVENQKVIEEVRTELVSTWAALAAANRNLESSKVAVEARELALKVTEEEYRAGLKILNDVLKAQQELFEAKYLAIQAEKEYFVSQCAANALIGRMNPRYLKLEMASGSEFSCKDHFDEVKSRIV
ncbi:MAG: TolC family protein [Holosporales bacterium]|jgi:outer membrane protein TolC|nr:TolC family protein [Holosporales bacterium]